MQRLRISDGFISIGAQPVGLSASGGRVRCRLGDPDLVSVHAPQVGMVAGAAMQNPTIVAAFGVEPRLVYMTTFAYGSALAGLAGTVMAPLTGVAPSLGLAFIAKIFIT